MVIIAGAICSSLICIGLTYRRVIQAGRTAAQLKVMIAQIGSAEGGLIPEGGVVNNVNRATAMTDRPRARIRLTQRLAGCPCIAGKHSIFAWPL